ncbi:MAG: endonuclease/exonuclease/phosphatase family protein [Haloarculaceae archaeon]
MCTCGIRDDKTARLPDGDTVKILSCNAGYLLDYDGSLSEYVLKPHRAMVGSATAEERATERLVEVIADEEPDVVCLLEVDQGSVRTASDGQVAWIAELLASEGLDYRHRADTKYGDESLVAELPVLEYLSNGVLVREGLDAAIETHHLDKGPKRLVTEIRLGDLSIFAVHLAMSGRGRRSQLDELADLVADRERVVVCGDFNAYDGLDEVEDVLGAGGLVLHNPGETVPKRPLDRLVTDTRTLDLFLTSPDVPVSRCDVIPVQVSDHRPVVLEFED